MSTHNTSFCAEARKILCGYLLLSGAMHLCVALLMSTYDIGFWEEIKEKKVSTFCLKNASYLQPWLIIAVYKVLFSTKKYQWFSYFSIKTSVILHEVIVLRSHNIHYLGKHLFASLSGSVWWPSDLWSGSRRFNPSWVRQYSFVEIDHEIFSVVILSLPLIQEGQLSVSLERMFTSTG